jgi:hypothetical protein
MAHSERARSAPRNSDTDLRRRTASSDRPAAPRQRQPDPPAQAEFVGCEQTIYLGRALEALRRRGESVPEALLPHLAPLGWRHVNLTGDYLWTATAGSVGPNGFRALRDTDVAEAA